MRSHTRPAAAASAVAQGRRGFRFAKAVGYVVSPPMLPPVLFGLVLHAVGAPAWEVAAVVGFVFVTLTLAPVLYLIRLLRRGRVRSIELYERSARTRPLLFFGGCVVATLLALGLMAPTAAELLLALLVCALVNAALTLAINTGWKISLHTSALAGFASLLLTVGVLGLGSMAPLYLAAFGAGALLPVVAWARVRIGAHTLAQVIGGVAFGLVLPPLELIALLHLGFI